MPSEPWVRKEKIGDCTLYLGDSVDVMPFLGTVDAVVTDPPYGMNFKSNRRTVEHKAIANDGGGQMLDFACSIPVNHSRYVWMRWDNLTSIPKPKSLVTWVKNNWSMGDINHEHARQTEVAAFYAGANHFFPNGRPQDVVHAAKTGNNFHRTEKPVHLMERVVGWTSGVVVDCFMGSGTTGVACVKMGRKFIGIELDPYYFEIACQCIRDAYAQPDMLIEAEREPEPTQESLL